MRLSSIRENSDETARIMSDMRARLSRFPIAIEQASEPVDVDSLKTICLELRDEVAGLFGQYKYRGDLVLKLFDCQRYIDICLVYIVMIKDGKRDQQYLPSMTLQLAEVVAEV